MNDLDDIPYGYCVCGCGQETRIATSDSAKWRYMKGEPVRFAQGHGRRGQSDPFAPSRYTVKDLGYGTPCWVWNGARNGRDAGGDRGGYASVTYMGVQQSAHRLFYRRYVGPIPDGLTIDHLCCVKPCVNPEHMEPVTQAVNNARRGPTKGRTLTVEEVRWVRSLPPSYGREAVAASLGVHPHTLSHIRGGRMRSDVPL